MTDKVNNKESAKAQLFRTDSRNGISSESDLHDYLRGNSRSVWIALGVIVVLLGILMIWVDSASPLFLTSLLFGE